MRLAMSTQQRMRREGILIRVHITSEPCDPEPPKSGFDPNGEG